MKKSFLIISFGIVFIGTFFIVCSGEHTSQMSEPVTVRSDPATLNLAEIQQTAKDKALSIPGDNIKGSLKNNFEQIVIRDINIINDHTTHLMWLREENPERLSWREVETYIAQVNEEKIAGFSDWRLPTVEELLSLMKSEKKGDYYIDPVFKVQILNTWTSDIVTDAFAGAWFVSFREGKVIDGNRAAGLGHVRIVRTLEL